MSTFFQRLQLSQTAFFKKNPLLFPLLLSLVGLVIRCIYLYGNTIPYMYDHARDSVEIMRFLRTGVPLLIGPRSSIDGLFFGPGWYYLTAPFYWLGAGHPLSPVGALLLLFMISVFLTNKYFGKWPAVMMTFTPGWWWIATSAWNPFPLALISLLLMIILVQTRDSERLSFSQAIELGLISGFGFHFSTAYAIFYPLIIGICLWHQKVKWKWNHFFLYAVCFWIPWLPQVVFDFRHQFLQIKSVIAYIWGPRLLDFSVWRVIQTMGTISSTLFWANLPGVSLIGQSFQVKTGFAIGVFLFVLFLRQMIKKNLAKKNMLFEAWMFILVPFLGYTLLHFSVWYVVGMYPAGALIISHYFSSFQKKWQLAVLSLYIMAALFSIGEYASKGREQFLKGRNFLPVKIEALGTVRKLANGQPFSSYEFVPDVYDYTYQYLYFWQAQHGWQLPVEFSYQPNVATYYQQKEDLLKSFAEEVPPPGTKPKYLFFIVEKPIYQNVLDEWWTHQLPHRVINEVKISEELTIYQAVPTE
ncbi:MAG: hypothetical protein ABI425_03895 [Patescibacteria group bacterium]